MKKTRKVRTELSDKAIDRDLAASSKQHTAVGERQVQQEQVSPAPRVTDRCQKTVQLCTTPPAEAADA